MGTEVATSTESQQLVEEVLAATQTLVAMSTQSLGDLAHEVSAAQYRALDALAVHGRLQMAELAQLLGVRPSTAGRMCDRLVARRLVGRRRAPQDRRIVMVALSSNGRRVVEAASEHRRAVFAEVLGELSTGEQRAVATALRTLVRASEEHPEHQCSVHSGGAERQHRRHSDSDLDRREVAAGGPKGRTTT